LYIHIRKRCIGWKKENFLFKESTDIGMKRGEREHIFIKNYITRDIDSSCRDIRIFDPLVDRTIPKQNTPFRTESEFSFIVRMEIWPTSTAKSSKSIIIWCDMKKSFNRGVKV
jgi:hypothetical protein